MLLPKRKRLRLPDYDYASEGMYFITICTDGMRCIFGNIVGAQRAAPAEMQLNQYGKIVESVWQSLPEHHSVILDYFQIMPNHVHFIVELTGDSALSTVIRSFKAEITKQIHRLPRVGHARPLQIFQRNFYEHVIRNDRELFQIRQYIENNPESWELDEENPNKIK